MPTRFSFFITASLLIPGCFSPEVDAETEATGNVDGSSSGADTDSPSTSMVTTDDPQTTADPTTDGPTTDGPSTTNGPSTTDGPSTSGPSTTDDASSSSGGPSPFCGDGNLDPGEDCDDGDGNGLDQACLPDCNLNVCGDGNLGPDEVCDDGADDNILEVGACAPDCSTVIEEKVIRLSAAFGGGNFQPNPVGFADAQCPAGSRALFSVAGARQANNGTPFAADDLIDWPLQPYTAYARMDGTLVWITDSTPLLGVRDGAAEDLINPIVEPCVGDPSLCLAFSNPIITGMNQNWTPSASDTCNGWTSISSDLDFGAADKTTVDHYLRDGVRACSSGTGSIILLGTSPQFYCFEQ